MRFVVLFVVLASCTCREAAPEAPPEPIPEGATRVRLTAEGLELTTPRGTIKTDGVSKRLIRPGEADPEDAVAPGGAWDFPVDFPIPQYPGSTVAVPSTPSGTASRVSFLLSSDAPEVVVAHYVALYPAAVRSEVKTATGVAVVLTEELPEAKRTITVGDSPAGTSIALYYEPAATP